MSLWEREKVLQIRTFIGLMDSNNDYIRKLMKYSVKDELNFRDVAIDKSSEFLQIPVSSNDYIRNGNGRGTSNILCGLIPALYKLRIGVVRNDDKEFLLKDLDEDDVNAQQITVNRSNCTKIINNIVEQRHVNEIQKHPLKGHFFVTLKNSPNSNYFMKPWSNTKNNIVEFAIKARCNALVTGEN